MITITGSTGQLGRDTIKALLQLVAPSQIVALARDTDKAADLQKQGVEVRQGDYDDPASLEAAFRGSQTVLLISSDAAGEKRVRHHRNAIEAAQKAGVSRLVYTGLTRPSRDSQFIEGRDHAVTESALRASGLDTTIFRNTLYLDMLPLYVGQDVLSSGKIYFAAGEGRVSYALRAEIGQALANVLGNPEEGNQTYEIAPAPSHSMSDVAAALSEISGQSIEYVPISGEQMTAAMREHQVPDFLISLTTNIANAMEAGEFDNASPDFERLLGRKPTDLKAFLTSVYAK